MKKLAVIAFVALVALSACTKVEPDVRPAKKVSFAVGNYAVSTKANSNLSDVTTEFQSRAFLHANGAANGTHFFGTGAGETVTYNGTNAWEPVNEYFWPLSSDSYINFVCWYDKNGTPDTANLSETSLSWNNRTIVADDEIMFADAAWRYSDNTANGTQYDGDNITTGVPVLFHHALARVKFVAKIKTGCNTNASGSITWKVYLKNMSVSNVHNQGTLSLTNEDLGTPSTTKEWSGSWESTDTAAALAIVGNTETEITTTAADVLAERSILPQSVENMTLSLTWTISTYRSGSNTPFSTEDLTFSGNLAEIAPLITDWSMGHKITYTLEFDPSSDSIVFSPAISDWTEDTGNNGVVVE